MSSQNILIRNTFTNWEFKYVRRDDREDFFAECM